MHRVRRRATGKQQVALQPGDSLGMKYAGQVGIGIPARADKGCQDVNAISAGQGGSGGPLSRNVPASPADRPGET